MSMLGAQLEDLANLTRRMHTTSGDVVTTRDQSTAHTTEVVTNVRDAARRALDQITAEMSALSTSVSAAVQEADSSNWTGSNADRFRGAASEFQQAMTQAGSTTNEAFTSFNGAVDSMSATLEEYVGQLATALTGAEESARAMGDAVESQRANLDQVMNSGLSVA